ncbi:MAG: DUF6152 family protein [Acidobacteria bacterium]|nr:DUF6152 family protein [Acidobacteriota bacterium]
MMNKLRAVFTVVVGFVVATGGLWAHHSDAVYDQTTLKIIKGTVRQHMLVNPHQVIKLRVQGADGRYTAWTLIGANVSSNRAVGWTKETLQVGDPITAWGFAYRDGKPNMTWMRIVKELDGRMLPISGNKNDKLARFLSKYGKDQMSQEEYEVFERSINWVEENNPRQ